MRTVRIPLLAERDIALLRIDSVHAAPDGIVPRPRGSTPSTAHQQCYSAFLASHIVRWELFGW